MSGPVDVLETMDHAIRCVRPGVSEEHYQWHKRLTEARASVAELIRAAQAVADAWDGDEPWDGLITAISRCKGEI